MDPHASGYDKAKLYSASRCKWTSTISVHEKWFDFNHKCSDGTKHCPAVSAGYARDYRTLIQGWPRRVVTRTPPAVLATSAWSRSSSPSWRRRWKISTKAEGSRGWRMAS